MPTPDELRRQAEELAQQDAVSVPEDLAALAPAAIRQTLHDLRVHQIELEMQNEELRRAQGELDAARERYFDLYDLAPVGYVTVDETGLILEGNLTAATLLGVARGVLVKRAFAQFIHSEDQGLYYRYRQQLFAAPATVGKAAECELRLRRHDGTALWARLGTTVASAATGTRVLRIILNDISVRKQAEGERVRLEGQLYEAQKLEAVGRLAGGVAHEFNNLLMGIMNYVELCRDVLPPEHAVREYLDEINGGAEHAADLTRQLLAFARKQIIAPTVLDLNDAVTRMLKTLQHLLGEDISLAWMPGAAVWTVQMDPSQLDQILANLASNARDAIDGVGQLSLETRNVVVDGANSAEHAGADPGEYVQLVVSDNGCGLDKECLERVFDPFATNRSLIQGTGLGLPTVYGIIKQNHGFVCVSSELVRGTTFRIYLPRVEAAVAPEAAAMPKPVPGGRETILVAEDEKSIRITTGCFLEKFGYTVLAAESPEAALRLAANHPGPIHLLLSDVIMPGMDGRHLAERLRATRPGIRCLFMSGDTAQARALRGVLDEGEEFLSKPFSREDLATAVRAVLAGV
jgi:PAS domain S-box-containing protein